MEENSVSDRFIYFSLQKNDEIKFNEKKENISELVLPRHHETNDLDVYYLQSMLKYFDPSKNIIENEILDAFPVISLAKDKNNKFYKLSLYRLREFYKKEIDEDEYIQASMKHLFMYSLLANPTNKTLKRVIQGCLERMTPIMYCQEKGDTVDYESYQLHCLASYVPTSRYRVMKLLKGWIEGALHFYDYSIMFFDCRFAGFDDFSENIIDIKTEQLFNRSHVKSKLSVQIYSDGSVVFDEFGLYYEINLTICNLKREWLFTSPNNDNERDGKVMMFRNKDLGVQLEKKLTCLFPKGSFRLNEVFKWNRYPNGGKFNSHYDTMFVKKTTEECSLYTLLIYLDEKRDRFPCISDDDDNALQKSKKPSIMYLSGEKEIQVRLSGNKAYVIPHWVKHRVEGEEAREFFKTEIVFKNKGAHFDQALADAFDQSCYYMLQSIRHPELKDIVSQNFNTINEARFYKSVFVPKLINNIYFIKTIYGAPFQYYHRLTGNLMKTNLAKIQFITDGTHYYFKIKKSSDGTKHVVSRNEAMVMLSVMQLDVQLKKMFMRSVSVCDCEHNCTDYYYDTTGFDIEEKISYWETNEQDRMISDALEQIQFPSDMEKVYRVGNISLPDIRDNPEEFYFAACQNLNPCRHFNESLITEITSRGDGNYSSLNVDFIGDQRNVVKIRQHSFKNGIVVRQKWMLE